MTRDRKREGEIGSGVHYWLRNVGQALEAPRRWVRRVSARCFERHDRGAASEGSPLDPEDSAIAAALARAAAGPAMPPDLQQRSWGRLEAELFSSAPTSESLRLPAGGFPPTRRRMPLRLGFAAAAGTLALAVVAWQAPFWMARSVLSQLSGAWSHVNDYSGNIQLLSRIPGEQWQWSGEQWYARPDRMRSQWDVIGLPASIIVHGASAVVDSSAGGVNRRGVNRLRFLARALRVDEVVGLLEHSRGARWCGVESVLGESCSVVECSMQPEDRTWGDNPLARSLPRRIHRIQAWISRRRGLPMQVEMDWPDGSVAVSYRFTRLDANVLFDPRLLELPTPGWSDGIRLSHAVIPIALGSS